MKRLVLAGGGHAHLKVLERLAHGGASDDLKVILITPSWRPCYSAMIPGWMAGFYRLEQCFFDLRTLARRAGVRLLLDRVVGLEARSRTLTLASGETLAYDLLSLDVGSETDLSWFPRPCDAVLPIKPLEAFVKAWKTRLGRGCAGRRHALAVVGGGASAVELALAARRGLERAGARQPVRLVCGEEGVLAAYAPGLRRRACRALARAGVTVVEERATGYEGGLLLASGERLSADTVIAAPGPRAPAWLRASWLALDDEGYVLVDATHRSCVYPEVFAAGDVCSRQDIELARSGVHAVRAGALLGHNLLAAAVGASLHSYRPRRYVLYLLSCGDGRALGSWGPLSVEGRWVWRWKDRIDGRFMRRFGADVPG